MIDTFRTRPAAIARKRRTRTYTDPAQETAALSCLGRDGKGSSLLGTARRLIELERQVCNALPSPLGSSCRVLRFEDGKLTLGVPAATHSAKLRQLAPRLVAALEKQGWQVNGIAVRVQATLTRLSQTELSQSATRRDPPRQLGEQGRKAIAELHQQLRDGPLADAVGRLMKRSPPTR
ncbi:DciA family protein [Pigmentiphaga sp. NML080357]|uniref:DciA family protein n=1 Tax=Pigmentiphaga sp. NML080357 TaxID=2008675 RepID=UPI00130395C7|nr:DciA family protein [Pigmentiphaga sp. NML080357]